MSQKPTYEELEEWVKNLESELQELKRYMDRCQDAIYRYDIPSRCFVLYNKTAHSLFGILDSKTVSSKSILPNIYPEDMDKIREARNDSLSPDRNGGEVEYRYYDAESSIRWMHDRWIVIRDTSGDPIAIEGIVRDETKRKQAEEKLHYLAYFDELTGLPNRTLFQDRLKQAIARSKRLGTKVAVMFVDIDRLKSVNDALGHQAGDVLIQEVGKRISEVIREEDTVARISGDEFMVLAENIDFPVRVQNLGERIVKRTSQVFRLGDTDIYPKISIGYTLYPNNSTNIDVLVKQTDIAMYEAKKSNFSKVRGFVDQEDWMSKQFYMEQDLKRALENEEFRLAYQPQIDLKDNRVIGVEALLRWQHPEKGLIYPGDFIPMLERTGVILPVSEWIIKRVCQQLKSWQQDGIFIQGSVNLSAQQLDTSIFKTIREALQKAQLEPEFLEVEITETAMMQNIVEATKLLNTLSEWGIKIALDDFGKGYSSLSYIHQLPIDKIKIDKYFIYDLPENQDNKTLVQTIITMAHNLGKKALAEGVERQEQVHILRKLGCNYAQGFFFAKPQAPEHLNLEKNI